jgi:hypothetical protein
MWQWPRKLTVKTQTQNGDRLLFIRPGMSLLHNKLYTNNLAVEGVFNNNKKFKKRIVREYIPS